MQYESLFKAIPLFHMIFFYKLTMQCIDNRSITNTSPHPINSLKYLKLLKMISFKITFCIL